MKNKNLTNFLGLLTIGIFIILSLGNTNIFSQNICSITTVKLIRVQGRILFDEPKNKDDVKIILELYPSGGSLKKIAQVETKDGFFEFNNVKKGKYRLRVLFFLKGQEEEVIPGYDVVLNIQKSNRKKSKKYLKVKLKFSCHSTEVSVFKLDK